MVLPPLEFRKAHPLKPPQPIAQKIPLLKDYLAELADPRQAKGLRHPLTAILSLCCVAIISGAKTPQVMADWWYNRQGLGPFLALLGFRHDYGPSKSTLYRVLSLVTVEAFEAVLTRWIEAVLAVLPPAQTGELEAVNLAGKTLRGSQPPFTEWLEPAFGANPGANGGG